MNEASQNGSGNQKGNEIVSKFFSNRAKKKLSQATAGRKLDKNTALDGLSDLKNALIHQPPPGLNPQESEWWIDAMERVARNEETAADIEFLSKVDKR